MARRQRGQRAWFSRSQVADFFDTSLQVFDRNIRRYFPPDCVRKKNGRLAFYGRGALDAWAQRQAIKMAGADPLLVGSGASSPALEKYRTERYRLARLDRLEREGTLLRRDHIIQGLQRVAGLIRSAGETLQRDFGVEAFTVLDEALSEFQAGIDDLFGQSGGTAAE